MRLLLLLLSLLSSSALAECDLGRLPPQLGGPIDAVIDQATLDKWKAFRQARTEERMLEAWDPSQVHQRYRITQKQIDENCLTLDQLVDVGRALFLRDFTFAEGLGTQNKDARWYNRFQNKADPAAHATSCANCHWKGGFAGGGDRVDNAFLQGDGNTKASHQERNPIPLSGLGWIEALASEMSAELQTQKAALIKKAEKRGSATSELSAKGVPFGALSAKVTADKLSLNYSELEGITPDLIVKPFGWQGRFASIAEMVAWSFETHLGLHSQYLQMLAEQELLAHQEPSLARQEPLAQKKASVNQEPSAYQEPSAFQEPSALKKPSAEITPAQIIAVSTFLATLPSPVIEIPVIASVRPEPFVPLAVPKPAPEFTQRWALGLQVFEDIGCASCHRPKLTLEDDRFRVSTVQFSLHETAAYPRPEISEPTFTAGTQSSVYLFSDLKRYDMGYGTFITRPLWGLRNSAPYGYNGSANVVDQAIALHNSPQGAAQQSAERFGSMHEKHKADLRVFLYSLMRAAQIRVR